MGKVFLVHMENCICYTYLVGKTRTERQAMKKKIDFGKIDYLGNGRKANPVTVEIELKETDKGYCFAASGAIWNHIKTDMYCGGQCLDTIAKYVRTPEFMEVHRLWKLYHLNDMHAGTREQEAAIDAWKQNNRYEYKALYEHLKSVGLYEVEHEGKPYTYGSGWVYWDIPAEDLEKIKALF